MAVSAQVSSSSPGLPETVRYYIERKPGNILVPLVPVDQLLYQPQGVPSQLSQRRIFEEKWQFVTEATEAVIVLPASPKLPTTSKYRAPDHNVMRDVAIQESNKSTMPELRTSSIHSITSIEYHENKNEQRSLEKDQNSEIEMIPFTACTGSSPLAQQACAMKKAKYDDQSDSLTGSTGLYSNIEGRPLMVTNTTDNHIAPPRASYTPPTNMTLDILMSNAEKGNAPEPHIGTPHPLSFRVDKDRTPTSTDNDNKLRLLGLRTTPIHPSSQDKTYCTHWISTGECSWGFRCRYKHEMPSIDILKRETGFRKVPRWYKEKMAIQSRGPTWMESRLQAQKKSSANGSDDTEMSTPREFPDPSLLRSLRQKSGGIVKQDLHMKKAVQEPTQIRSLIEINSLTQSVDITDAATPVSVATQAPAKKVVAAAATSPTEKKTSALALLRRLSEISWSSDTSDSSASKQVSNPKSHPKKDKQDPAP